MSPLWVTGQQAIGRPGRSSEQEFFARLEAAGLLVRKRFSRRDPGQVTGYAVATPGYVNGQGMPVWFGGGKLAADLTLPKLRQRWPSTGPSIDTALAAWCPD